MTPTRRRDDGGDRLRLLYHIKAKQRCRGAGRFAASLLRVYPNIVKRGLTLKGYGRRRTLKDLCGRHARAVCLARGHRGWRRKTF